MKALSGSLLAAGTIMCACIVAFISVLQGQGSRTSDARGCASRTPEPPTLAPDSIGYLRLDEELGKLRERCSTARDTTVRPQGNAGIAYPGLVFQFDSLTVFALQYGESALNFGRPADGWMVSGTRATIQRKVPLSGSWSALHSALGTAQANARGVLAVRFCSFPNAIITLNILPDAALTKGGLVDLSTIPPDATIHHLFIMSRSLASHLQGC